MPTEIRRDAELATLSSFALPARARELAELVDADDLPRLLDTDLDLMLLGSGSNTLFVGDYDGRLVRNRLRGEVFRDLDADRVLLEAAAGQEWHALVEAALDRGLWGLENLALIPGAVGAAPMQNIGAYGVELSDVLDSVRVFDRRTGEIYWLPAEECELAYRTSRFKHDARFVILGVRLVLMRRGRPRLDYPALADALEGRSTGGALAPRDVADAVISIRKRKLPDPSTLPNAGSFFKNPVVAQDRADELADRFPGLPTWTTDGGTKLSAAWMIDSLGWRGRSVGGAGVYERHALVLINRGGATGRDVLALARSIRASVEDRFGVTLEAEPRLVGGAL